MTANYAGLQTPSRAAGLVLAVDPGVTYDRDAGFAPGDLVFNTVTNVAWLCHSNASGAALWLPMSKGGISLIGRLVGANMNSTADQAIPLFVPSGTNFRVTKISITNASISLTTAAGGVYPAASKAGTALVASTQVYSSLTTGLIALDATLAVGNTIYTGAATLFLALTTAQGAAATADVRVYGELLV